jgi:hypothetical protein
MSYVGKKVLVRMTCKTGVVTRDWCGSGDFYSVRKLEIKMDNGEIVTEFPDDVYIFGTKHCNEFIERRKNYKLGITCNSIFEFEINGVKNKVACPLVKGHKHEHHFYLHSHTNTIDIKWEDR